jgi:hypothetical protein
VTRDPGLQPQRTALAWQRTGLAALAAAGGAVLAAVHRAGDGGPVLTVVLALVALALTAVTAVPPRGRPAASVHRRLLRAAVATIALAAVGLLLAVR